VDITTRLISLVFFAGLVSAVTIGVLYARFKKGLPTRIFAYVTPAIVVTAVLCYYSGGSVALSVRLPLLLFGAATCIVLLTALYRSSVRNLSRKTTGLFAAASEIAGTARQSAATASEQATTVAEVTTTVAEITQTSTAAAATAQEVMTAAADAVEKGRRGVEAIDHVSQILELVQQVGKIAELVNDLADQSNLLAVNAGIEAAKAGEHGRGFAVVAVEVRRLAEQSKQNARQIRAVINKSEQGRAAIETAREAVQSLALVLEESVDRARQISATATQQAAGIRQISEAMTAVAESGRNSAAAAKQLESASAGLQDVAGAIKQYVTGR